MDNEVIALLHGLSSDLSLFKDDVNARIDVLARNVDVIARHVRRLGLRTTALEEGELASLTPLPLDTEGA